MGALVLVVARYEEDDRWLLDRPPGWAAEVVRKNVDLPNAGREAGSYAWWVERHYDELDPGGTYAFLQGNPWPHAFAWGQLRPVAEYAPLGGHHLVSERDGAPNHPGLGIPEAWGRWVGGPQPELHPFPAGAMGLVPGWALLARPRDYWAALRDWAMGWPPAPWILERIWPTIWSPPRPVTGSPHHQVQEAAVPVDENSPIPTPPPVAPSFPDPFAGAPGEVDPFPDPSLASAAAPAAVSLEAALAAETQSALQGAPGAAGPPAGALDRLTRLLEALVPEAGRRVVWTDVTGGEHSSPIAIPIRIQAALAVLLKDAVTSVVGAEGVELSAPALLKLATEPLVVNAVVSAFELVHPAALRRARKNAAAMDPQDAADLLRLEAVEFDRLHAADLFSVEAMVDAVVPFCAAPVLAMIRSAAVATATPRS